MTTNPLEPFEANGQDSASLDAAPSEPQVMAPWHTPEAELDSVSIDAAPSEPQVMAAWHTPDAELDNELASPLPRRRRFAPHLRRPRGASGRRRHGRLVGFAVAFMVGVVAALFVLSAAAFAYSRVYGNRVLPGVHVGSVDLSGLTRDEAIARLQTGYAYLGQGEVTVTTPVGVSTITYQQVGRGPDFEMMADAAMAVGHSGNVLPDVASAVHFAIYGQDVPVAILVDPDALAQRIHQLAGTSSVAPQDAQVTASSGNFSITPSTPGHGLDERLIGSAVLDQLNEPGAPADIQAGGTFTTLNAQISDKDAQNAIARALRMMVDVTVKWSTPPPAAPPSWTAKSWTISASQIRSWIVFGMGPDGTYEPAVDPSQVQAYLSTTTANTSVAPVEPGVVWGADGKPAKLSAGKDGLGVDVAGTTSAVSTYLDTLETGGPVGPSVEVVTAPVHPQITSIDSLADMVDIGHWTVTFYPDVSNGMGKNIRQPATNLNGQVIAPGQQFSFLEAVGPIDADHGFTMGGVILGGKSDHTGAMGGGICSASTTLFNAAATAGVQIDERHAHYYYISRYPIGRDATVYSDGVTSWDVKWTNDTPHPIVIRAWTTYGSASTITIQLWSWPTGRTVTWTGGGMADIIQPVENPPEYVSFLAPGQTNRAEYPGVGFRTGVTRVVTDASGNVIHNDVWYSSYSVVNGQLQIGGSPPAPPPPPADPTPTPVDTPTPDSTASGRRRSKPCLPGARVIPL
jgi:vancomycin resistance protein YoaR